MYVINQYLEFEGIFNSRHRDAPGSGALAIHGHAFFPRQAWSVSTEIERVAESNIDVGDDDRLRGFARGRLLNGSFFGNGFLNRYLCCYRFFRSFFGRRFLGNRLQIRIRRGPARGRGKRTASRPLVRP